MIGYLIVALRNLARWLANCWRWLWRRRVDYVRFDISGPLPEFAPAPTLVQRLLRGQREPLSLQRLRRQLAQIAADPQARGVVLVVDRPTAGWATLQSLRDELARFRAAGKHVVAYMLAFDAPGYYLACAADRILAPPTATFWVLGVRIEARFLKDALAMAGLSAQAIVVSPYKSAYDQLAAAGLSPEAREQLDRLLDQRYATLLAGIAAGRGLPEERVRELIDQAPLGAVAAQRAGLIDTLCYEDEWDTLLANAGRAPRVLPWDAAARALRLPYLRHQRRLVGVVALDGTIVSGVSRQVPLPIPLLGGRQAGANSVAQALRQAERSRRITAVVLYVNSPGGEAFASDLIWREVLRLRHRKPVVVVMGDAAASGGYYVSAPAAAIIAQPATLTGSIGVAMLRVDASGLLERAGVRTEVLARGAHSGLFSAAVPPGEDELRLLRGQLMATYDEFKQRVCSGRGMSDVQLEPLAGGRVWTGQEALGLGLVDQLGGLPEGVARARELAGLPPDPTAPLALLRGGRAPLPPLPFPPDTPTALLGLLAPLLRPQVWAVLPLLLDDC